MQSKRKVFMEVLESGKVDVLLVFVYDVRVVGRVGFVALEQHGR